MFAKTNCKLCNKSVKFVLRHLKKEHPEILMDADVKRLDMSKIMKKYFDA